MIEIIGTFLSYAVPFLFILTMVVFFHELGHFLVARYHGVHVEAFSIGFGKEIVGWDDSHGTRWKISWLPFGGYCKMRGERDAIPSALVPDEADSKQQEQLEQFRQSSYDAKNVYARIAIASAGPLANVLLAIVLFWGIFFTMGKRVDIPQISQVIEKSVASEAGLKAGDIIRFINDKEIGSLPEVQRMVMFGAGERLAIDVERKGEIKRIFVVPRLGELVDPYGNRYQGGKIGVGLVSVGTERFRSLGLFSALGAALEQTWMVSSLTLGYLGKLIIGKQDSSHLSGPIRIVKLSSDMMKVGFVALLSLTALLSISLAIVNLLPIPVLDGGHILFYLIEAIKGSPLSEQVQEYSMRAGLIIILGIIVFVTLNDISHLGFFSDQNSG